MLLIKVEKDGDVEYFSSQAKCAKWMNCFNQQVKYALERERKIDGWKLTYDDDPNILNGDIDKALYFIR